MPWIQTKLYYLLTRNRDQRVEVLHFFVNSVYYFIYYYINNWKIVEHSTCIMLHCCYWNLHPLVNHYLKKKKRIWEVTTEIIIIVIQKLILNVSIISILIKPQNTTLCTRYFLFLSLCFIPKKAVFNSSLLCDRISWANSSVSQKLIYVNFESISVSQGYPGRSGTCCISITITSSKTRSICWQHFTYNLILY